MKNFLARFFAKRTIHCCFIDVVSHRPVHIYEWRGSRWMSDGRLRSWIPTVNQPGK